MTAGCLGPNAQLEVGDVQTFYFGHGDPPPHFMPHLTSDKYEGLAKGAKQILWERGLYKDDMIDKIPDAATSR